jgi:hypothetical protein
VRFGFAPASGDARLAKFLTTAGPLIHKEITQGRNRKKMSLAAAFPSRIDVVQGRAQ